mgnify:CR=1 FL=1
MNAQILPRLPATRTLVVWLLLGALAGWASVEVWQRHQRAQALLDQLEPRYARMVGMKDGGAETDMAIEAARALLLELADSFITYRSRYRLDPMLPLVLDLLLLDEGNPRSLAFQLAAISDHLGKLPDGKQGVSLPEDRRHILSLLTAVRLADIEAIAREPSGRMIEALMLQPITPLPLLSNAISSHYFNLIDDAPHRVHTRIEPRP